MLEKDGIVYCDSPCKTWTCKRHPKNIRDMVVEHDFAPFYMTVQCPKCWAKKEREERMKTDGR